MSRLHVTDRVVRNMRCLVHGVCAWRLAASCTCAPRYIFHAVNRTTGESNLFMARMRAFDANDLVAMVEIHHQLAVKYVVPLLRVWPRGLDVP